MIANGKARFVDTLEEEKENFDVVEEEKECYDAVEPPEEEYYDVCRGTTKGGQTPKRILQNNFANGKTTLTNIIKKYLKSRKE